MQVLTIPCYAWSQAVNLTQRAEYLNALLSSPSSQLATSQAAGLEPLTSIPSVRVSLAMPLGAYGREESPPPAAAPFPSPFGSRHQQLTASGEPRVGVCHSGSSRSSSGQPHGPRTPPPHGSDMNRMNSFLRGEEPVRTFRN